MGGKNRSSEARKPEESGISRRKTVASVLLLAILFSAGVSASSIHSNTVASFSDTKAASGAIVIDGNPTLNYEILDNTGNNKAQFDVIYQVEWVSGFDEIYLSFDESPNNQDDSATDGESFSSANREGSFSTGSYGGQAGNTFEFIFEVYSTNEAGPVIRNAVNVTANGTGSSDGDFGNANSPKLESFTVYDNWNDNGGNYSVSYSVSNTENFTGDTRVRFEAPNWNSKKGSKTIYGDNIAQDTVSYGPSGGKSRTWRIFVEVVNENGIAVSSGNLTHHPRDGDAQWPEDA